MEGVGIDMEWSLHDWGLTLTAVNGLAGIGSHFVEMNYGNLVNHASILAITNPLASGSFGSTSIWGSVDLPVNTSVYLGFQLDASHGPEFGWVELFYDGSTVQALNSATDRDGIGIYVGKFETAAIPEPSTLLLLLIGAPFLRRRKQ